MKADKNLLSLVLACCALAAAVDCKGAADRPNFVFLLADDLGWADLKCYGSGFHETPNLDKLARDGMRFSTFYSAGTVCSPTRSSIMTGRYPVRTGITDWIPGQNDKGRKFVQLRPVRQLALEETTFAEVLKPAGYQTVYIGKWHLGGKGFQPTEQGFDIYIGDEDEADAQGGPREMRLKKRLESTGVFTKAALDFLQNRTSDKPFVLFLSYHDVHTPIQPVPELVGPFEEKAKQFSDPTPIKPEHDGQTRMRQDNPAYASMLSCLDQSVGKIRRKVEELGLAKNTIIIFASDNGGLSTLRGIGPTSNAPLRAGKGWIYEGGIRVPLIVCKPGLVPAGLETDVPLISCDFFPTILELAGLPARPKDHLDGVSFAKLLQRGPAPEPRPFFWHYPHYHGSTWTPGAGMRDGDWKLIEFFETGLAELYNLRLDPSEQKNLAAEETSRKEAMLRKLHDWQKSVKAQMPVLAANESGAVPAKKRKKSK